MVKLLMKNYKLVEAKKDHRCEFCHNNILKGSLSRKYNSRDLYHRLHELCYKELSLKVVKGMVIDL